MTSILQNWAWKKLTFCHSSKLNVCLKYRLIPRHLPQQFADLMFQTTRQVTNATIKESLYKTHYQCSYLFRFTGIAITWRTKGIEIFEVVIGRTYDNNYYNHAELVLSNLVQNDAVIWNRLQIVISHSQGKNINKIHKWHMTKNKITVSVWEMHSVMQPLDIKTLYQCFWICKYTESWCEMCWKLD